MRADVLIPAGTRIPPCTPIRFLGAMREKFQGVLSKGAAAPINGRPGNGRTKIVVRWHFFMGVYRKLAVPAHPGKPE